MRRRIKELVDVTDPKPRAVLLDMGANYRLDISSADMLAGLVGELKVDGVELLLSDMRDPSRDFLRRSKVAQTIGEERIYPSMQEGVEAFQSRGVG